MVGAFGPTLLQVQCSITQLHLKRILQLYSQKYDIQSASIPLTWEKLEAASQRPILDLSSLRKDSADITATQDAKTTCNTNVNNDTNTSEWDQGQKWQTTKTGLKDLGVLPEDMDSMLVKCPQLLRLDSNMVLDTAKWVSQEFGNDNNKHKSNSNINTISLIELEPRLLGYRTEHVSYGLEFLSIMMMMTQNKNSVKSICFASPEFLIGGIEGGIQEKAVKQALSAASDATSKASQTIAADAMTSLKQLSKTQQQRQQRKGL